MKTFSVDSLRQAAGHLHIEAAQDLVQRTLAQHGLSSPGHLAGLSSALGTSPLAPAAPEPAVEGASFRADRFSCAAGGRDHMVYVPASADKGLQGLIMMLHGCTQTHADFARGTGMNAFAEKHRLIMVYPQQARGDNAQSCWNWFSPGDQRKGRGEPEILAQMALHLADAHAVPRDRIFVAGLSAGAAMAVILGQTYPEVFTAVGAHSGLPFAAAKDLPSAFAAMSGGPGATQMERHEAKPVPTIVFHGSADRTVHPLNGERIVADTVAAGPVQTLVDRKTGKTGSRGHSLEVTTTSNGQILAEHWVVDALGHAWSGGRAGGTYTDPQGPDASAHMVRFFLDQPRRKAS